jgi:putative sugar O-methyltransferase
MALVERVDEAPGHVGQIIGRRRLSEQDLARIELMFEAMEGGEPLAGPSKYWIELNRRNAEQMALHGYENFKRTVALNYFTWTKLLPWDSQVRFLVARLPLATTLRAGLRALAASRNDYFNSFGRLQAIAYNFLTLLLWNYLLDLDLGDDALALREPPEGSPPIVEPQPGLKVSQDLANSILEYESFKSAIGDRARVLEVGAGYGRTAYATMKLRPGVRYVIADIPPALFIAERYLSSVCPERTVFRYRDFEDFEAIRDEFEQADLAFVLSSQITRLPAGSFDLVINISSLHEMRPDQISFYLGEFNRLLDVGGHFFTKQWRRTKVPFERVAVNKEDYPIPNNWEVVFNRVPRVQTRFFEALYRRQPDRLNDRRSHGGSTAGLPTTASRQAKACAASAASTAGLRTGADSGNSTSAIRPTSEAASR